jgi:hypothetical protein
MWTVKINIPDTEGDGCRCNPIDLHLKGVPFESQQDHWLCWPLYFCGFQSNGDYSLSYPFQ